MPQSAAEAIGIVVLLFVIGFAVATPRRLPEATAAAPAALLVILLGVVSLPDAAAEVSRLGPTVGFLAAILLLAHLCDEEGVFAAAGALMARRCRGRPIALLGLVFAVASGITALLSLDATVVLLTPVVFATAASLRLRPKPHVYACTHLANSASLLLPVSNLTNLLAFGASGLSFTRFGLLMVLPWLAVIGIEYAVFRQFFGTDLRTPAGRRTAETADTPVFALVVVGLTLLAFGLTSLVHVAPVWAATAGAGVLAVRRLLRRQTSPARLLEETNPLFCVFVLALGVVVRAVEDHGLGGFIRRILPDSSALPALLLTAVIAAVLANLVNNLPAILVILGAGLVGPGLVLAALIGVNVGPNLTYVGSLATLLWRRTLRGRDAEPVLGEFLRLGALTVPVAVVAAVLALWVALQTIGA